MTGVVTNNLEQTSRTPRALIDALDRARTGPLMAAMDAFNARSGRGAIVPVREAGETARLEHEVEMRTPRYTTQISELLIAYAKGAHCRPSASG